MADKIQATGQVRDGFYILNLGFVCMYLMRARGTYIAFDTGMKVETVKREMRTVNVDPSKVSSVLLTHSDRDHVGGLGLFPKAKVYLPKAEVAMIDHTTACFFGLIYNKSFEKEYETLEDNQAIEVDGVPIRCLSTPGHTAGHMSYLVDNSILIAGDTLNLGGGKIVMDRKVINIDNVLRKRSIGRLASLDNIELLCTMHSGYTDDFTGAARDWK